MALITCPACGKSISDTVKRCIHCECEITVCPECKTPVSAQKESCPVCGFQLKEAAAEVTEKAEITETSQASPAPAEEKPSTLKTASEIFGGWEAQSKLAAFLNAFNIMSIVSLLLLTLIFVMLAHNSNAITFPVLWGYLVLAAALVWRGVLAILGGNLRSQLTTYLREHYSQQELLRVGLKKDLSAKSTQKAKTEAKVVTEGILMVVSPAFARLKKISAIRSWILFPLEYICMFIAATPFIFEMVTYKGSFLEERIYTLSLNNFFISNLLWFLPLIILELILIPGNIILKKKMQRCENDAFKNAK